MEQQLAEPVVTKKVLTSAQADGVLYRRFFGAAFVLEPTIFSLASKFTKGNTGADGPSYNGGMWDFVELSNGGLFMYPRMDMSAVDCPNAPGTLRCRWADNYSDVRLTPEGLGIAACSMAMSHLSFQAKGASQNALVEHFEKLQEFIGQQPECGALASLLD